MDGPMDGQSYGWTVLWTDIASYRDTKMLFKQLFENIQAISVHL